MNPALKDIVEEELQNFLDTGFIYPTPDSEWVCPLVLVPNNNWKWRICVDYRELNKSTKKDHFLLPFIDKVLDGLVRKNLFSFLDGFSGYNKIQISLQDQDKTTFTCHLGTFSSDPTASSPSVLAPSSSSYFFPSFPPMLEVGVSPGVRLCVSMKVSLSISMNLD